MDDVLKGIHEHMRGLGLGALAHANMHANYISPDNDWWNELSVLQAAHAAEILIKARIAQEHPLLIFENVPRARIDEASLLSIQDLMEGGRTFQFTDLPDRLWATTGIRIPNLTCYKEFGRLRNKIQHFAAPADVEPGHAASRFIYEVIDPFIHECWGLYAIDFNEDYEPHLYLVEGLIQRGVLFLVSPASADCLEHADLEWPKRKSEYKKTMEERFHGAKKLASQKD